MAPTPIELAPIQDNTTTPRNFEILDSIKLVLDEFAMTDLNNTELKDLLIEFCSSNKASFHNQNCLGLRF